MLASLLPTGIVYPHFQASPARECVYMGRAWYLLSREHDVIEIGPEFSEQKGNVLRIVQPTMRPTLARCV